MSSNSTTLLIKQAQIMEVNSSIAPHKTDKVIDATGLTLLPVVIDPQVHFLEPGLEHQAPLTGKAEGRGQKAEGRRQP